VAEERNVQMSVHRPSMRGSVESLVFIDETSLGTNMIRISVGERLVDHAPAGHRCTQTFIAALRHDGIHAPGVTDGTMDGKEKLLVPATGRFFLMRTSSGYGGWSPGFRRDDRSRSPFVSTAISADVNLS